MLYGDKSENNTKYNSVEITVSEVKKLMINLDEELMRIDNEYSETEMFLEYGIVSLMFYEPVMYKKLIADVFEEQQQYETTQDRERYVAIFKKVYLAQRKKLTAILENIRNRTMVIEPEPTPDEMVKYPKNSWKYMHDISHRENVYQYAETRIKRAIFYTNQELYILRKYPEVYYNKKGSYIGGEFYYRYEDEVIIYDKVHAVSDGMHHFLLCCNERTKASDKRTLLNILAYLNGCPNFEFLSNPRVNQRLDELYRNFDLLDNIRLRQPNYLKSDSEKPIYLELPIIKNIKGYKMIAFKKLAHEGILDLYHASLKQFEPLPRCVFLFRVFEYAAAYHYKPLFTPTDYKPEDALNYYLPLAMSYNPNPLYFIDFGNESKKAQLYNYFTVLKKEANKILYEWSTAPYLASKSYGEIIYLTGRNFTAHGASGNLGERNMQYDYDKNYLHINNVNIVLEIIARYVIELLNPELKNVVERRTVYYKEKYKEIFEHENVGEDGAENPE